MSDRSRTSAGSGSHEKRKIYVIVFLAALLLGAAVFALGAGEFRIGASSVVAVIAQNLGIAAEAGGVDSVHNTVVWNLRLPRILLAVATGMALGASGAVFQGCFRNPLVEPYILGISSGAAFGAALAIVYPAIFISTNLSAFVFGSLAVAGAYFLARTRGETPVVTLILAGVIIGSVFMALVSVLKYTAQDTALREIVFWIMGGLYFASWRDVSVVFPVVAVCISIVWMYSWKLNVLSMGDEESRTLGVNPEKTKAILIVLATLVTAVSVAAVGIIAWVGLMMPHAARLVLGPDHRYVVPAAAVMGGIYMIVCDTLARTLTTAEIPIGIITSILGAPYLFYLLRSKGRVMFGA